MKEQSVYRLSYTKRGFRNILCLNGIKVIGELGIRLNRGEMDQTNLPAVKKIGAYDFKKEGFTPPQGVEKTSLSVEAMDKSARTRKYWLVPESQLAPPGVGLSVFIHDIKKTRTLEVAKLSRIPPEDVWRPNGNLSRSVADGIVREGPVVVDKEDTMILLWYDEGKALGRGPTIYEFILHKDGSEERRSYTPRGKIIV